MKLSVEEKNALETISAISAKDFKTVQEVFKVLLISSVLNLYDSQEKEFSILIPYIANLKISFYDENTTQGTKTKLEFEVEPQTGLKEEICNYVNGDPSSIEKMLKKNIVEGIMKKLDMESIEIDL